MPAATSIRRRSSRTLWWKPRRSMARKRPRRASQDWGRPQVTTRLTPPWTSHLFRPQHFFPRVHLFIWSLTLTYSWVYPDLSYQTLYSSVRRLCSGETKLQNSAVCQGRTCQLRKCQKHKCFTGTQLFPPQCVQMSDLDGITSSIKPRCLLLAETGFRFRLYPSSAFNSKYRALPCFLSVLFWRVPGEFEPVPFHWRPCLTKLPCRRKLFFWILKAHGVISLPKIESAVE